MSDMAAWGTFIGSVCLAVGGLVGGLIVTWFKSSGRYQVELMRAQAELNADELKKVKAENVAKDHSIEVLTTRVLQLETNIKDLRDQGHSERDKWYAEQMKTTKENYEREMKCHAEAAELRGQVGVLLKLVSDRLPGPLVLPTREETEAEPA